MENPFPYSSDNKRYHTWNHHMRATFGQKVAKVGLDAGFTCPNLDGRRGWGGCSYCSAVPIGTSLISPEQLHRQFVQGSVLQSAKWPDACFLAYFQARTNTYAPVAQLRTLFEEALSLPGVVGLCIATRADVLPAEVTAYLADLSQRTWLLVELGLQTVQEDTALRLNRCHSYGDFLRGYHRLRSAGIRTCIHLINGLPGESWEQMLENARAVAALSPHSVKLHMLHLLKGTAMADEYSAAPFPLLSRKDYVSLVCDQLELLPPQIVIQRLTGDPPRESLLAPPWTLDKRKTLNAIDRELARRDTWQGRLAPDSIP